MPRLRSIGGLVLLVVPALCLIAASASAASAQSADATVTMRRMSFAPTEVHITPGQTVLWNNTDFIGHTVTADDNSFDSGDMEPGDTFSQTFTNPGTYQYYCVPHGSPGLVGMAATIVVDDPNAP